MRAQRRREQFPRAGDPKALKLGLQTGGKQLGEMNAVRRRFGSKSIQPIASGGGGESGGQVGVGTTGGARSLWGKMKRGWT